MASKAAQRRSGWDREGTAQNKRRGERGKKRQRRGDKQQDAVEGEGQQGHMGEVWEWKGREEESAAGEKKQQLAQPVEEIGKGLKRGAR